MVLDEAPPAVLLFFSGNHFAGIRKMPTTQQQAPMEMATCMAGSAR